MNARQIAYKVLYDIQKNKSYSNISINKHFNNYDIKDIDRGLATELIYGVVENQIYIDYIIDKLSKIKVKKMNDSVITVLRMGVYQIVFLENIAQYSAVDESVKLVKKYDFRSSGFVNAILRNVIRQKDEITKIKEKNKIKKLSIKYSYNEWIVKNWADKFGIEFCEELLEENSHKPKLYIRTNTLKISRDELISKLENMNVTCNKVKGFEEAIEVKNLKQIQNNKLFKDGLFTIQDLSSMLVAKVANPNENSLVLDICSAPGGKTTHMATLMKNTGKVIARDIFAHKVKLIEDSVKRLGLKNVEAQEYDATKFDNKNVDKFDYVICDVPCSGFGIVRRKPEIKYKNYEEIKDLPIVQKNILNNASKYLKVGGTLVYSTCTIQSEEDENIIEEFLKENKNYKLDKIDSIDIDLEQQDTGMIKIFPNIHSMDGFFIAKLVRFQ
ncbi:MAG: 16S rRNA (cytosine(967)-C(5))-methyltransferase RsmB [Clostridioides sp.]|nr:16S rRNA (cytosine(967)-C(5))-methyltransferase RsmB [Clostridioides sp.]